MKSIDAPRAARVCVCLLYVLSTVCERRSVDANATLVGGWLFRRPVIYRLSCAQNSLSSSLSLSFSFSCSLALSFSSSFPPVLQRAGKLDVFSSPGGRRCRVSAPESSIFFPFVLFAFLYVPLLGAGFRRGRSNVASVLVFTRIIHNA